MAVLFGFLLAYLIALVPFDIERMTKIMSLGITGRILAVALWLTDVSCNPSADVQIIGTWRIDSIYDNYNGFSFTNTQPFPQEVYEYRKNNTVLRKGMGEQLEYKYLLTDSTLSVSEAAGNPAYEFIIVHLDKNRMALKKNRKFLFPGKNQVRYEVRFFTRIDAVGLK